MSQLHKISGCDNAARALDVVFIHGLGGDAFKTWRHGDDESTSWPHWVGEDFSNIGIWTLGYAANPVKLERFKWLFGKGDRLTGHAMPLPRRAGQVLDQMAQKGLGRRPMIIVGHSLGGLLAKQLLRDSSDSEPGDINHAMAANVRAVMFLGTPHGGSPLASMLHRFRAVFGSTVAVEGLRAHDAQLENLKNWYRNKSPGLGIVTVTYYETIGCGRDALTIVDSTSAHPAVGSNPVGLDEDHLTLAKPRSRDAQVCDALRDLIRNALTAAATSRRKVRTDVMTPVAANMSIAPPAAATMSGRIPRESPPRAEHYFGRAAERERLMQRLRDRRPTAVIGPGGLGKTALAAEALHEIGDATLTELYPDGWLFLDLYQTRANADAIWSRIADRLVSPNFREQAAPQERARQACLGKRLLVIIEGGEDADGRDDRARLVDLLSVFSSETIRLLLTRDAAQASAAESISLRDALEPGNAAALLDVLSGGVVSGEPRQLLLNLLTGHPLAITWAGALVARGDEHPNQLIAEWTAAQLPALNDPARQSHTLRWLYDRSVRSLDADARSALVAAGLLAHAPVPLALVASVLTAPDAEERARTALRRLSSVNLMRIDVELPGHWQFAHVLAHRYARESGLLDINGPFVSTLASSLRAHLAADSRRAHLPALHSPIALALDHARALLSVVPPVDKAVVALWQDTLFDLPHQLMDRGRTDLVRAALAAADAASHALPTERSAEPLVLRSRMMLHVQWATILAAQGDLPGARRRHEEGLIIARRLVETEPGDPERLRDLSMSFMKLGDVQAAQGDLPGARRRYQDGLAIFQSLAEVDPDNAQWQHDLSVSFNNLGDVLVEQGDLPSARRCYEHGLAIAQQLAETEPSNAGWQRDLTVSFAKLGSLQVAQGDLPGARRRHEDGLAIAQRLAEADPGNAQCQRDLNVSFGNLGDVQAEQGDLPGARRLYEDGLAIAQRLAEADPANAEWQRDLSVSFAKLGDVQVEQGDLAGGRDYYEKRLAIAQRLAQMDPGNVEWQRDLSVSFVKLGNLQVAQGDLTGAHRRYEERLAITRRLADTDPGNAEWQRDLSVSFAKLGDLQATQDDLPGARHRYVDGLKIVQRLNQADPSNAGWQRDLSLFLTKLAEVAERERRGPEALAYARRSLAIDERLCALDPTNARFQRDVQVGRAMVARLRQQQGGRAAS